MDRIDAWLAEDPDETTRAEAHQLREAAASDPSAAAELREAFGGRLAFGTAGLRGKIGPGPNRMNRLVVIQTAGGLARYLHHDAHERGTTRQPSIVVGFDARHRSADFARDTCAVMAAAGVDAYCFDVATPTPVLAFAIRHLGCDAGVMVTASHNPREDNGYKVYLGDGSQIAPPVDEQIAGFVEASLADGTPPLAETGWQILGEDVRAAYEAGAVGVLTPGGPRDLRIAYTPLHGVGWETVRRTFLAAGFDEPSVVAEQASPDPDFPTLAFPNPEEAGAVDAVIALARHSGADLVIANDPDADRCAVCVPTADGWRMLTGDEVGILLGHRIIAAGATGTIATTIVSSTWLAALCHSEGVAFTETLTGFKWLTKVPRLTFAYEEALGYCVAPGMVLDKDGITAALLLAEMAAELKAAGRTLVDQLDDLAVAHGLHATSQTSIRSDDLGRLTSAVGSLATNPPEELGGHRVEGVADLARPGGALPPTPGVRMMLSEGARVIIRPSGTEPKLKCYLQVIRPTSPGAVDDARIRAAADLQRIAADVTSLIDQATSS